MGIGGQISPGNGSAVATAPAIIHAHTRQINADAVLIVVPSGLRGPGAAQGRASSHLGYSHRDCGTAVAFWSVRGRFLALMGEAKCR